MCPSVSSPRTPPARLNDPPPALCVPAATSLRAVVEQHVTEFLGHNLPILCEAWACAQYSESEMDELTIGALAVHLQSKLTTQHQVFMARTERDNQMSVPHVFLVVSPVGQTMQDTAGRASGCVIVDPLYKELFTCIRPTAEYRRVLGQAPAVMVMGPRDVEYMVRQLCCAMRDSFSAQRLSMPPWRQPAVLLRYWRSVVLEEFDEEDFVMAFEERQPSVVDPRTE